MDDPDHESRLNELERRIDRLISVAGMGVGLGAAALVVEIATKDLGLSGTIGGILGGVAFFAAFILLVLDIKQPPKMTDTHAVSALKAKRLEIINQLDDHREQARSAVVALDHVEAALRLFDPNIDLSEIRPRKVAVVLPDTQRDSCRIILEMLRTATKPISTSEITAAVMKARGMDIDDSNLHRVMANRTLANLKHWSRKRGLVRSMPGPGQQLLWEVAR